MRLIILKRLLPGEKFLNLQNRVQQGDTKSFVDSWIEEMEKLGSDFTPTNMEFYRNGAKYILVMGLNYAGEERMQQDV